MTSALPSKASLSATAGWHCPLAKNPCRNNIVFINFPNKRCKVSYNSAIIAIFAQIFKCFRRTRYLQLPKREQKDLSPNEQKVVLRNITFHLSAVDGEGNPEAEVEGLSRQHLFRT